MSGTASPRQGVFLGAFLAGLAELQEAERVGVMRGHFEYTLDVLQAHEEAYFSFLAECATLAADNMHDVRLENVELTVATLQNPPAKTWGEVFTDVALGLALQVGILFGWEIVAGGVVSLIGSRHLMNLTRTAGEELSAARSENLLIKGKLAQLREMNSNLWRLERGGYRATYGRGGWNVQPTSSAGEPFTAPGAAFNNGQLDQKFLREESADVAAQFTIAWSATATNAVRVAKALETYDAALKDATVAAREVKKEAGDYWRDNIGNEKGGVLIGTTTDVIEGIVAKTQASAAPAKTNAPVYEPFLTSELVGRYLTWASEERLQTVEYYARVRAAVRTTSDDDLLRGDALLQHIATLATEFMPRARKLRQHAHAARPAIVKGIEAALWREYLTASAIVPALPANTSYFSKEPLRTGQVVGDYLIVSAGKQVEYPASVRAAQQSIAEQSVPEPVEEPPPLYEHQAQLYFGMSRLPDLLAGTLYKRFVRPHLTNDQHANELRPFEYRAARYDNVAIPPRDGLFGYPDPDAVRCIDEMRFMVVRFFSAAPVLPPSGLGDLGFMSSVTGADAEETLKAWSAGQVKGKASGSQGAAEAALRATLAAELRARTLIQFDAAPSGSLLERQIAELHFVDNLTDLNHDIQAYLLIKSAALEISATPEQRSEQDLVAEIEREKEKLRADYERLLELARANRAETQRLIGLYQAAVDAIGSWQVGSDWVWYGPTQDTDANQLEAP